MTTLIDNSMPKLASGEAAKVDPKPVSPEIFVNGVEITLEDIQQEIQNHEASNPGEAVANATRALIVRELLLQKANALGIEADPMSDDQGRRETDEDAKVRQLLEQEVDVPRAGEEECQRYYEQHIYRFSSETIYEARHILFAAGRSRTKKRVKKRGQKPNKCLHRLKKRLADLANSPASFRSAHLQKKVEILVN